MDDNLRRKIRELVKDHWSNGQRPLYFSNLPAALRRHDIDLKAKLGDQSLKDAILLAGIEDVKTIQDPSDKKVWALVPADTTFPPSEIFANARATTKSTRSRSVRYDKAVWAAFAKPNEKDRRYLRFSDSGISFEDIFQDEEVPEGGLEVPESFIRKADQSLTDDEIAQSLTKWISDNKISLSQVSDGQVTEKQSINLNRLLELDDEDLARIHIPLDLIKKIL